MNSIDQGIKEVDKLLRDRTDEGPYTAFGKHIAIQMEKLTPYQAAVAQIDIINALLKAQFQTPAQPPNENSNVCWTNL
jgi:hypothetical protein